MLDIYFPYYGQFLSLTVDLKAASLYSHVNRALFYSLLRMKIVFFFSFGFAVLEQGFFN